MTWSELWKWWVGLGTPAAAIQQLSFVVFTAIATVVALLNVRTWKKQTRANLYFAAAKEVLDSAALVCEHILIERLSPSPMVHFSDLKGFDFKWQKEARSKIRKEVEYWNLHKQKLDKRVSGLRRSAERNVHALGTLLNRQVDILISLTSRYVEAVNARIALIEECAEKSNESLYAKMVSLTGLSKNHPLLWRKERNLESLEFETDVRRAMDEIRAEIAERSSPI